MEDRAFAKSKKKDKISHDETIPAEILSPFILLYLFFYITYTLYNNKYVNSIGFWEIDKLGKWRNTLREQCRFCDFLFGPPALRI